MCVARFGGGVSGRVFHVEHRPGMRRPFHVKRSPLDAPRTSADGRSRPLRRPRRPKLGTFCHSDEIARYPGVGVRRGHAAKPAWSRYFVAVQHDSRGTRRTARSGPRGPGSSRFGRPESALSTSRRQEPLRSGDESGGGPRRQLHVGLICRRSGCRHCESPRTVPRRTTLACRTSPRSRRPDPTTRRARRLRNTRPRHARTTTRVPIESTRHRCGPSGATGRLGGGGPPARLDASREGTPGTGCTPRVSTALGITPLGIVVHALSSRRPHHLALLASRVAGGTVPTPSIRDSRDRCRGGEDHHVDSRETRRTSHLSPRRRDTCGPQYRILLSQ